MKIQCPSCNTVLEATAGKKIKCQCGVLLNPKANRTNAATRNQSLKAKVQLWNPSAAANWSLIFSPIFGGWVHAENWRELGHKDKAQKSMLWVYVTLASLVVRLFTGIGAPLLILLLWYFLSAKAQVKFLRENNISYEKKTWDKPCAIGLLGWGIWLLALLTLSLFGISPINVRDLSGSLGGV